MATTRVPRTKDKDKDENLKADKEKKAQKQYRRNASLYHPTQTQAMQLATFKTRLKEAGLKFDGKQMKVVVTPRLCNPTDWDAFYVIYSERYRSVPAAIEAVRKASASSTASIKTASTGKDAHRSADKLHPASTTSSYDTRGSTRKQHQAEAHHLSAQGKSLKGDTATQEPRFRQLAKPNDKGTGLPDVARNPACQANKQAQQSQRHRPHTPRGHGTKRRAGEGQGPDLSVSGKRQPTAAQHQYKQRQGHQDGAQHQQQGQGQGPGQERKQKQHATHQHLQQGQGLQSKQRTTRRARHAEEEAAFWLEAGLPISQRASPTKRVCVEAGKAATGTTEKQKQQGVGQHVRQRITRRASHAEQEAAFWVEAGLPLSQRASPTKRPRHDTDNTVTASMAEQPAVDHATATTAAIADNTQAQDVGPPCQLSAQVLGAAQKAYGHAHVSGTQGGAPSASQREPRAVLQTASVAQQGASAVHQQAAFVQRSAAAVHRRATGTQLQAIEAEFKSVKVQYMLPAVQQEPAATQQEAVAALQDDAAGSQEKEVVDRCQRYEDQGINQSADKGDVATEQNATEGTAITKGAQEVQTDVSDQAEDPLLQQIREQSLLQIDRDNEDIYEGMDSLKVNVVHEYGQVRALWINVYEALTGQEAGCYFILTDDQHEPLQPLQAVTAEELLQVAGLDDDDSVSSWQLHILLSEDFMTMPAGTSITELLSR